MEFVRILPDDRQSAERLSAIATEIVKEHYDPIIGAAQNDYMISKFQTVDAITEQLSHGYSYYFVNVAGETVGFMGFYPRDGAMYLSKLYLYKDKRGRGYSREMVRFVSVAAKNEGLTGVELNVNRFNTGSIAVYEALGFRRIREEKNDIGNGFYMDDYVYRLDF